MKRRNASVQVEILPALLQVDSESVAHAGSDFDDIVFEPGGADERELPMMHRASKIAVPVLTLLAEMDGVQKIGAGVIQMYVGDRAEVRNGNPLDGRLGEKQESQWSAGRLGECLELLERRPHFTELPAFELREATCQRFGAVPGALTRPAQHLGMNRRAAHGFIPLKAPGARLGSVIERRRETTRFRTSPAIAKHLDDLGHDLELSVVRARQTIGSKSGLTGLRLILV